MPSLRLLALSLAFTMVAMSQSQAKHLENFFGEIIRVNPDGFDCLTNPNADPDSAYRKEVKTVKIDAATKFVGSSSKDFLPGRGIQVVGVTHENGSVLATRITVYDGNKPVHPNNNIPTKNTAGTSVPY